MEKQSNYTIGLIGNPNVGKSTLFNTLTGAKQHVGNWPGKTVEKKEGAFEYQQSKITLIDLPGVYSLTAYSEEESIAASFIINNDPDVVLQIVDAQNIERNLYLTIQLIELGAPLILVINMVDLAAKSGVQINIEALSELLNIPVVIINAKKKHGLDELMNVVIQLTIHKDGKVKLTYSADIKKEINILKSLINKYEKIDDRRINWFVLKMLEGDKNIKKRFAKKTYYQELNKQLEKSSNHLTNIYSTDINTIITNARYGFIKGLSKDVLIKKQDENINKFVEMLDTIVTNRFLGIPIFLFITWLMFQATFKLSEPLMRLIELLFSWLGEKSTFVLEQWNASEWTISLWVDGILSGVGGVLVFVPIIGIMFLLIALLEDSGYMARVAYVMDRLMHRIGLHGKAFIPLIMGFGCNVPGIMATRTLESKRDRLLTILLSPFMSCSARLPVYALFAGAFFTSYQGWVIFSLYLLGIILAIIFGLISKKLFFKKLSSPFVIELPPYRLPTLKGLFIHVWERVYIFVKKAGTVILAFSIIIWLLASLPVGVEYASQESVAGVVGETISPVFKPLGFDNWQSSIALMFGFVAKEVVVGTFGTLYGIDDVQGYSGHALLTNALQEDFTPLSAYSFMVFVLLYIPCMAVLAVIKRETNSWKWPLFVAVFSTFLAWLMALIVYQLGKLLFY